MRQQHVEFPVLKHPVAHVPPLVLVPVVQQRLERRRPLSELLDPVGEHRLGRDDHVRAADILRLEEVAEKGDGLDRLAQALRIAAGRAIGGGQAALLIGP